MTLASVVANRRSWHVEHGNCLDVLRSLPAGCVHCVCTSPPYYGLRSYLANGHTDKAHEVGLESRPDCAGWATGSPCGECFVCRLVAVFAEVKRVLRPDGTVWLNVGDSYANNKVGNTNGGSSSGLRSNIVSPERRREHNEALAIDLASVGAVKRVPPGAKHKDLLMVPARLALALQAAGWYVRSDISLCKVAPMPESVTDRPTRATERLYMLTASSNYYYDQEAERVPAVGQWGVRDRFDNKHHGEEMERAGQQPHRGLTDCNPNPAGRNLWDWWEWRPEPSGVKHYAVMPSFIPRRCFRLGASSHGCCPACNSPWVRTVEREKGDAEAADRPKHIQSASSTLSLSGHGGSGWRERGSRATTLGWKPSCACPEADPVPCLTLDPFVGSGTCGIVARQLGLRFIGVDLNADYVALARRRIGGETPLFDHITPAQEGY